jgi:putative transposase
LGATVLGTRACKKDGHTNGVALKVARRLRSQDILKQLGYLFIYRGLPACIRSDNGSEFTAKAVRNWLGRLGVQTLFIEPGSPWENGYMESS